MDLIFTFNGVYTCAYLYNIYIFDKKCVRVSVCLCVLLSMIQLTNKHGNLETVDGDLGAAADVVAAVVEAAVVDDEFRDEGLLLQRAQLGDDHLAVARGVDADAILEPVHVLRDLRAAGGFADEVDGVAHLHVLLAFDSNGCCR